MEIPKHYNPKECEEKWYSFWEKRGYFRANPDNRKPKFVIMMPPPNITGIIHMGHVLNNTLQDILIRFKRMQGYETLWQPGTDHAGIATQNVVEKELAKEGKTRFDLGRKKFVERVWKWKEVYERTIKEQIRRLGASCDWSRYRFTLDPQMADAVLEAFVRLFNDGLIYRGARIINWCPRCGTALADDEVEHREEKGKLYYIRYPLLKGGFITVATTRPETYLGDTAVAVHPDDNRYRSLIGERVKLPLITWERKGFSPKNGEPVSSVIPVISSPLVDPKFGTGAVKVTPAHDPNDFDIGEEFGLPKVLVMDTEAKMNENAGPYRGLDRYEARERILGDLEKEGFLERVEEHIHSIGHCYRCETVIEPYLSEQWFVKMKPLAEYAMKAVEKGEVKLIPEYSKKIYFHWLKNVRDWCISRQIWWGHPIPVYTCLECGKIFVSRVPPKGCPGCNSTKIKAEEDVLDTWFSSWLWPFSTLGWPLKTKELESFYPGDILITGWEILFFWVTRMIMAGYYFMGKKPFHTVYLHGIVRDERRRKLSKSLGNSPDPLDLFEKYGTDGVRMSMLLLTPKGQDVIFSEKRMEVGRNFANKIWNASRLLLINSEGFVYKGLPEKLELEDKWILSLHNQVINRVTEYLDNLSFNEAAWSLYDFIWHRYCDHYLEAIKPRLQDERRDSALSVAFYVLHRFLKLLHPYMPFITEEIWQKLPTKDGESIMISKWPEPDGFVDEEALKNFDLIIDLVHEIREIRATFSIPPKRKVELLVKSKDDYPHNLLVDEREILETLAGVGEISKIDSPPPSSALAVVKNYEFYIPLGDIIDVEKERKRFEREIKDLERELEKVRNRLQNKSFLERAPQNVIDKEREKEERFREKLKRLKENLERL
jgi:valyl-tRNA synthetase